MNILQDIIRKHGNDYLNQYGRAVPLAHRKVIRAIQNCGTGAFGSHLFSCAGCGQVHSIDGSCGNRHCPVCQGGKSDAWLQKQLKRALPVNYFMIT